MKLYVMIGLVILQGTMACSQNTIAVRVFTTNGNQATPAVNFTNVDNTFSGRGYGSDPVVTNQWANKEYVDNGVTNVVLSMPQWISLTGQVATLQSQVTGLKNGTLAFDKIELAGTQGTNGYIGLTAEGGTNYLYRTMVGNTSTNGAEITTP